MRDFDNDGWVDVLTSGNKGQVFINNGDLTFTELTDIFDGQKMESYALGDLNDDGFVDIYGGYANIYTNPSTIDDIVWINEGNNNNHLSVSLVGIESNRNAIGARISIYGAWGIQIREVRSGESYGISNALKQYFGIGSATEIDSMVISWPSGQMQTEYDIPINASLIIEEGACLAASPILSDSGTITVCDGESLLIFAPDGYQNYEWSNGSTGQSILVTEAGVYSLKIIDDNGCLGFSQGVNVLVNPQLTPTIGAEETNICNGETVTLTTSEEVGAIGYTWSNGDTGLSTVVSAAGIYTVVVEGTCDNYISNEIEVIVSVTPGIPVAEAIQELLIGNSGVLEAEGDNLAWYDEELSSSPVGFGNMFTTPVLDVDSYFYVEDRAGVFGMKESVGMIEHSGTPYSSVPGISRSITFDALEEFTLDSVTVYTDVSAERRITILDQGDNVLVSKLVEIQEGKSQVFVGIKIPSGNNLRISTDDAVNIENIGAGDPRLQRSSEDVNYPYMIDDVVSLKDSPFGGEYYYYFYDWKITTADDLCASERKEILAKVVVVSNKNIEDSNAIQLYPNPSAGEIYLDLQLHYNEETAVIVTDITGRRVYDQKPLQASNKIDLSKLAKGLYIIQLTHDNDIYIGKVILN